MAVIYLKHPVHGSKVAISDREADYDKTLGWVVYDPETERRDAPKSVEPVAVPDFLAPQPKRKGGRPRTTT